MMYVFRYEIMKEKYDALCITEKELQEKWKLLEVTFSLSGITFFYE